MHSIGNAQVDSVYLCRLAGGLQRCEEWDSGGGGNSAACFFIWINDGY
jgi:hypothetical protein